MIRVTKGTVKADGEVYKPGDIIEGLSEKEEASLISAKVAERWGVLPEEKDQTKDDPEENDHLEVNDPKKDDQENGDSIKEKPEGVGKKDQSGEISQPNNNNSSDGLNIKFDAAAYVGGDTGKKTKAGK